MGRPKGERLNAAYTKYFRARFKTLMKQAYKARTDLCNVPELVKTSERWMEKALSPTVEEMRKDEARELVARFLLAGAADRDDLRNEVNLLIEVAFLRPRGPVLLEESQVDLLLAHYAKRLKGKPRASRMSERNIKLAVAELRSLLRSCEPQGLYRSLKLTIATAVDQLRSPEGLHSSSARIGNTDSRLASVEHDGQEGFVKPQRPDTHRITTDPDDWAKELIALLPHRRIRKPRVRKG